MKLKFKHSNSYNGDKGYFIYDQNDKKIGNILYDNDLQKPYTIDMFNGGFGGGWNFKTISDVKKYFKQQYFNDNVLNQEIQGGNNDYYFENSKSSQLFYQVIQIIQKGVKSMLPKQIDQFYDQLNT